jgi:hypothetical protein
MELSGWSAWCDRRREKLADDDEDRKWLGLLGSGDNESEEERAETSRILDLSNEIEKQQQEEDEQMMIRLIKIRHHLWT